MERRENESNSDRYLYRLGELKDYKVAGNAPDVRGWMIVDRENRSFGTIHELIVDPRQEKVRYLDVATRDRARKAGEHLLIPVSVAHIDEAGEKVIVKEIDSQLLSSYPSHSGDEISKGYELRVVERFNRPDSAAGKKREGTGFYNNEFFNEDRFYTNRNRNRGF